MHDSLMCNVNWAKRSLTNNPRCGLCENEDENTLHVLKDCKATTEIWCQVGDPASTSSFRIGNLQRNSGLWL